MTEFQFEALLYTGRASDSHKRMPDFPLCHQELKRKGMTKILLWQEYYQEAGENAYGCCRPLPPAFSSTRSCEHSVSQ